jgi:hypothetical protein
MKHVWRNWKDDVAFPTADPIGVFNDMAELPAYEIDGFPNDVIDPIVDWVAKKGR